MRQLLALLILVLVVKAEAAPVDSSVISTNLDASTTVSNSVIGTAQDWGLSVEEWQQYQRLMQGPAGRWYRPLSPVEVLGLYAETVTDQQHFAEVAAKEQHDKIAREIAFNNAFTLAVQKLYVEEPVIKTFDMSAFNPIQRTITQ